MSFSLASINDREPRCKHCQKRVNWGTICEKCEDEKTESDYNRWKEERINEQGR